MSKNERLKLEKFRLNTLELYKIAESFDEVQPSHISAREGLFKGLTLDLIFLVICAQKEVYVPLALIFMKYYPEYKNFPQLFLALGDQLGDEAATADLNLF